MGLWRNLCALAALLAMAAAPAHAALNKEGFWEVGSSESRDGCLATLGTESGAMFALHAMDGQVTFLVLGKKRWPKATSGVLATDKVRFDFTPTIDKDFLSFDEPLNDKAMAALREAEDLIVGLDGKVVFSAHMAGSGLAGALDGVIACSNGESGWWGKGAIVSGGAAGTAPAEAAAGLEPVYNKDGLWGIVVGDPGQCFAVAKVDDNRRIQLTSAVGLVGLAINSSTDLPQGRRGTVETDSFKVDFKPSYGGRRYFGSEDPFDSADLFALRRAKWMRVFVDGKLVVDARLEGSGFADAIDAVAACSKGESGWWGAGAKRP